MSKLQKIHTAGLIIVVLAIITNPLTSMLVIEGLVRGIIFLSRELGVYLTLAASVYIAGMLGWNIWSTREKVNIPKKTDKTSKAGRFVLK